MPPARSSIRVSLPGPRLALISLLVFLGAQPAAANTQYDPAPNSCQIIGDADVYGKGIRLSYYLQWASVVLGLWIAPEMANRTRAATNILTLSVFVNTLRGADKENSLMVVEWYIVQYLVFWLLFFNLPTSFRHLKRSVGSLVVLLVNYCIVVLFPIWLYWRGGSDEGRKDGCEPYVFLFAPIAAYNSKWLLASKVLSTAGAAFSWAPLLGAFILLVLGLTKWSDQGADDDEDDFAATLGFRAVFTFALLTEGASAIAFTEKTIQVNNIIFPGADLSDSGQLIPLLIGVFTLASVFWEGLRRLAAHLLA